MNSIDQKQMKQLLNIVNTITEATEHFQELIKQKEQHQSVFIIGSITDGVQALSGIKYINSTHQNLSSKLEKNILLIVKNLEDGKFVKILEITQFSLLPNLKKLNQFIQDQIQDLEEERQINIGIYGIHNPLHYYPQARIDAMVQESQNQNAILYFFGDDDVNFPDETINAMFYQNGERKSAIVPFPDVINNTAVKKTQTGRRLHKLVSFTNFFQVGNKLSLPLRLLNARSKYVKLLVPFSVCNQIERIHQFIDTNNKVVFKDLKSNRGEQIYFVTKKKNRYILLDQKKETILTTTGFDAWLNNVILKEKNTYIIQKYIHTRTKDNEPYHIRAHVQKDETGEWKLTYIYPRIGNKKSNLSNISTEGRIENFKDFLVEQHGLEQGNKYNEEILKLSIEVAWELDKLYGMAIDELGIDFAIDDKGKIWMHEANNGPQTAFHEDKRAVNVIGYAKYIHENGIMYSLHSNNIQLSNHFNAKNSALKMHDSKNKKLLAIIVPSLKNVTKLHKELMNSAHKNNIDVCLIQPNDIDYVNLFIRGHFLEDNEFHSYISAYPDIIFDSLKAKENEGLQFVYEEFDGITFINNWSNRVLNRTDFQKRLSENNAIKPYLLKQTRIKSIAEVFYWLKKYAFVKLFEETTNESFYLNQLSNTIFELITGKLSKAFNEEQLQNYLQKVLVNKRIIIEALPYQFPIQQYNLHLIKNIESHEWNIVDLTLKNCANPKELSKESYEDSLHTSEKFKALKATFLKHSQHIANMLQDYQPELNLTELSITFDIHSDQKLSISSIVPDHPDNITNHPRYADLLICLGKQLLTK